MSGACCALEMARVDFVLVEWLFFLPVLEFVERATDSRSAKSLNGGIPTLWKRVAFFSSFAGLYV